MKEDDIRKGRGFGGGKEVGENEISAIQANGCRKEESDFLTEGCEAGRGAAGGCDERAWVGEAGEETVFVVDAPLRFGRFLVEGFVVFVIFPQGFVVGDGWVEGFACCEGFFEQGSLLRY